jgi:hypothetical protein
MAAPSSTTASADVMAIGKNKDSSGVYFDKDGNPIVQGRQKFPDPTVDTLGAVKIAFDLLKKYPSYRLINGSVGILKTEFNGDLQTEIHGVTHNKLHESKTFTITFKDRSVTEVRDPVGTQGAYFTDYDVSLFKRESTTITISGPVKKYAEEWRLPVNGIAEIINTSSKEFLAELQAKKDDEIRDIAQEEQNVLNTQQEDVDKIVELLGITKEEAAAYLAAGHTVDEAAKKVSDWNLASPSSRKAMIAQDALSAEDAFSASEFVEGKAGETIKYLAEPVDDMFKGIRKKYSERRASKAYIALVKESVDAGNVLSETTGRVGINTLLKFDKFFMQSVSEVDSEKYQIVETFNKPKIYFFDRRARIYNYSFIVENTGNISTEVVGIRTVQEKGGNLWRDEFKIVYEKYLRGTKSVEERVKAVIHYDGVTRIGYVLSCAMSMDSSNDNLAQMQITMFVESEQQRDVEIQVNKYFSPDPIKQLNAQEIQKKKTLTHIVGSFNSQKLSSTNTTVPVNIVNLNAPGRQTFPKNNYVELFLKEFPEKEEGNPDTAEKSSGGATVTGMTWIATLASTRMESVDYPIDGLFLSDTPEAKSDQSFGEGSNIPIELSGMKVYVVIDTTSKMVQEIAAKQGDKDAKIDYTFLLESSDKKEFRIRGSATLCPKVLEPSVSEPGTLQAKTIKDRQETLIEASSQKMTSTFNNGSTVQKLFTGSFELQLTDKVSGTVVALPKAIKVSQPEFKDFIASINESDKSLISGSLVATPKDVNTLKCEVSFSLQASSQIIDMTAESCIAMFKLDVGGTSVPIKVKFIRGEDKKDYKILYVNTDSVDKTGKLIPKSIDLFADSQIALLARGSVFFDKDPGPGIQKEILLEFNGKTTDLATLSPIGKLTGKLIAYNKWFSGVTSGEGSGVFSQVSDVEYPLNLESMSTRISVDPTFEMNPEEANRFLVEPVKEKVYVVNFSIDLTSVSTWKEFARKVSIRRADIGSGGLSESIYGALTTLSSQAVIKISKTSMKSAIQMHWTNANRERMFIR